MEWVVDYNNEKYSNAWAGKSCPVTSKVFDFSFHPFHALVDPVTNSVETAKMDIEGVKWWLEVHPWGVEGADGFMSCYLRHDSFCDQKVEAKVSILAEEDEDGNTGNAQQGPPEYFAQRFSAVVVGQNKRIGWDKYIDRNKFWRKYRSPGDGVSFNVDMSVFGDVQTTVTLRDTVSDDAKPKSKRRRVDVAPLLLDPTYSDMTLVVQGERIPAHKCLLCPRSSVFRAMFQHPMQEAASNEVQVGEGFEAPAVKAMLHYLYTDTIPEQDLTQQAARLMDLAVYYQMDDLKEYAESHLLDNLTAENVGEALQLGQLHGCKELVARAQRFIAANAKKLIAMPDFLASLDLESSHKMLKTLAGVTDKSEEAEAVVENK